MYQLTIFFSKFLFCTHFSLTYLFIVNKNIISMSDSGVDLNNHLQLESSNENSNEETTTEVKLNELTSPSSSLSSSLSLINKDSINTSTASNDTAVVSADAVTESNQLAANIEISLDTDNVIVKQKKRVKFPEDEKLIKDFSEPPKRWVPGTYSTNDLLDSYCKACEKQKCKPLNRLLPQLKALQEIDCVNGEKVNVLNLKSKP